MSQADGTIANDTGTNVRTDMQAQIQALLSTSKGNSAPSTIYAGQHWIDDNTPSASIWTEYVYDGAQSIAVHYIDTSSNVAYPVSAMPLLGFAAQGSPVMTGDIRTSASTAVPGAGNTTTGYNLSSNGSLHTSNNGSYVQSVNRNSSGVLFTLSLSGSQVGSISVSGSTTVYATSSDYRLKADVEPIDWREAVELIQRMNPVWFHWINDPMGEWVDGFIAHELADVLPGAVTGRKDDTRIVNGVEQIVPQGVDQAKLTPLLTAAVRGAIPYLLAKLEALEERLAVLEAGK